MEEKVDSQVSGVLTRRKAQQSEEDDPEEEGLPKKQGRKSAKEKKGETLALK